MGSRCETPIRLDVERTFGYLCMGKQDPTCTRGPQRFTKTFALDEHVVVRHAITYEAGVAHVEVEGGGTAEPWRAALADAQGDGHDTFAPRREHIPLRYMVRELPGLRFVRVPWLFDFACGIVLQQRVTYGEALGEYRAIAERFGPHDATLGRAFPSAHRLARLVPAELTALGIDARRASTLVRLAREHALHAIFDEPDRAMLAQRLRAIPGIGPWTIGMVFAYGAGDPDAVPLDDLHLPHTIVECMAGERRGTDERMLELLAPYATQRARVVRLILAAKFSAPALLRRR